MNTSKTSLFSLGRVLALSLVLVSAGTAVVAWSNQDEMPKIPENTASYPVKLVQAIPFTLDETFTHWYRSEQPQFDAGMLLVLSVKELALLTPRQHYMPVLQIGAETAEPLNLGDISGNVIAVLPGQRKSDGTVDIDLANSPIFFGEPALGEEMDIQMVRERLKTARLQGVANPSEEMVDAAMREAMHFANDYQLRRWAADLIEAYSPQEVDLVTGLRVPLVGE